MWKALFHRSVALSEEDARKEAIKATISASFDRCADGLEAMRILLSNDLLSEAGVLVVPVLSNFGNLFLALEEQAAASNDEEMSRALERFDSEVSTGKGEMSEWFRRAKDGDRETLARVASEMSRGRYLERAISRAKRIERQKRKGALWTPQDSHRNRQRVVFAMLILVFALVAWVVAVYYGQVREVRRTEQRLRDMEAIRNSLEAYRKEHGSYPSNEGRWDGVYSCWGQSREDWIPGLAPKYIPKLPRDPRLKSTCDEQYLYSSNGEDYKVIVHSPPDLEKIAQTRPAMIDPMRQQKAYGFWTEGFQKH